MTITITRNLDSDTLNLPELQPFIGKRVVITVAEQVSIPADPSGAETLSDLAASINLDEQAELDFHRLREISKL